MCTFESCRPDGGCSSADTERRVVAPEIAGSNPVSHTSARIPGSGHVVAADTRGHMGGLHDRSWGEIPIDQGIRRPCALHAPANPKRATQAPGSSGPLAVGVGEKARPKLRRQPKSFECQARWHIKLMERLDPCLGIGGTSRSICGGRSRGPHSEGIRLPTDNLIQGSPSRGRRVWPGGDCRFPISRMAGGGSWPGLCRSTTGLKELHDNPASTPGIHELPELEGRFILSAGIKERGSCLEPYRYETTQQEDQPCGEAG